MPSANESYLFSIFNKFGIMPLLRSCCLFVIVGLADSYIYAQVLDTTVVTVDNRPMEVSADSATSDSLLIANLADSLTEAKKPDIRIYPWPENVRIGQKVLATDSLIRWQYASDLVDLIAFKNAALPIRSGIQMRSDAFIKGTNITRFQELSWEGIPMDEPLSGTPMYEMMPINKLAQLTSNQNTGQYSTKFRNRTYQVNEPWSSLYFDEADGKYQNLAFSLTRNFSRKHNAELGYRQVRDGSLFRLSESEGNQIFLQNTYDLTQKVQFTQRWFSSQTNVDEPFGYAFNDAAAFSFNPFSSVPNQNSRQSLDLSVHSLGLKIRSDSVSAAHTHVQLYRKRIARALSAAEDTLDYQVKEFGLTATNTTKLPASLGQIMSETTLRLFRPEGQFLTTVVDNNWIEFIANSSWQKPTNFLGTLSAGVEIGHTNLFDSYTTYGINGGFFEKSVPFIGQLSVNIYHRTDAPNWMELQTSTASAAPQSLGTIQSTGLDLTIVKNISSNWRFNASAGYKQINDLPKITGLYLVNTNGSTWNTLESIAASMAINWQKRSLYAKYQTDYFQISELQNTYSDQRLLSTLQLGWKNYAFKKATFIDFSAELRNELLPFYGLARDPLTHLWQLQNTDQIPAYTSVLDLRLSARLRSIMIMVRYENAFDGQTQLGYFESLGYPAPARRLLFSVRALFKN